ncbi:IS66 family insertion sequence element accessory protein TnpB [Defluviicoccus vanus]|uniref:IS66 family insertion sequence element accessory protein TnpB n=1 Tax=Defluviicoccus vanus TaxID=111831 RepID=UPI0021D79E2A|nr:IS66 family insertion sequence element accessory protein TnpB [Defluviicoccus vanus]
MVQTALGHDPFSGTIYVFRCKRSDRLKLLVWDGSGLVMVWKRLEAGVFRWPPVTGGVMRLSAAQLAALLDGLDWSRMHAPRLGRPKKAQ